MSSICRLEFQFSPDVEWTLVSHVRVLVVLLHSPSHKRRFLKIASRKARLGYSYLLLKRLEIAGAGGLEEEEGASDVVGLR
ncbi:hypothetical protein BDM02DRAFT_3184313 [Thelephora ganbajun]|uniref:Uncharacterized protein n=1 Tax=Thelephora ganbajun TaxID=370292 RepID=A0ACB6ZQT5_THEGA|nr:hypothetical protein BDM02DRAFT_3184313 [Thelephora ganbajun]